MVGKEPLKKCIRNFCKAMCLHSIGVCPCAHKRMGVITSRFS